MDLSKMSYIEIRVKLSYVPWRIKYVVILLTLLVFSIVSLAQRKIRIDPALAKGASVSEVFREVSYLPLETTKNSRFGRIDQLIVTDEYYIILDYDTNSILIFYKSGKFHSKIKGRVVSNADPFSRIRFVSVNKAAKELSFKAGEFRINVYDFNGRFIRDEMIIEARDFYYFRNEVVVFSSFNLKQLKDGINPKSYELIWQKRNTTYKQGFDYDVSNPVFAVGDRLYQGPTQFSDSGYDSLIYFSRPYDYNIYSITPDSIWSQFLFVFPLSVSVPKDFTESKIYFNKRFLYLVKQNPNIIYSVNRFLKIGDILSFSLSNNNPLGNSNFLFNETTNSLFSLNEIFADSTNFYLPVKSLISPGILTAHDGYFFSGVSSAEMFTARDLAKKKGVLYSKEIAQFFSRGSKSQNPVIIRIRPL